MQSLTIRTISPRIARVFSCLVALAVVAGAFAPGAALAQTSRREVIVIEASGPVIPSMRSFILRAIEETEDTNAEALVIMLNTPGGSGATMQKIVEDIRASHIPVVVYVAPDGALAASAGTLITLAAHASAMAPDTAIGAASPVDASGGDLDETSAAKAKEIISAQARSLAERRGPEAVALADAAINEAKAVNETEALEANFVDFVARDLNDLLDQLDGFEVDVRGDSVILETAHAVQRPIEPSQIEQALTILVNPNVVFMLMTLGILAVIVEMSSPGGWAAGAIGVACLGLALYGLGVLPINWLGVAFILMAFVLFFMEVKAATHGVLGVAGAVSLVVGGILLFNTPQALPFGRLSPFVAVGVAVIIGGLFILIVSAALKTQGSQFTTGPEAMLGQTGPVTSALDPQGTVLVASERWQATAEDGTTVIPKGTTIEVVAVDGFKLRVKVAGKPAASQSAGTTEDAA